MSRRFGVGAKAGADAAADAAAGARSGAAAGSHAPAPASSRAVHTAAELGLRGCPCCKLVSAVAPGSVPPCPRCGCALQARRPFALQRTTACLIAAVLLYLPANLLPVMTTATVLTGRLQHTLLGGIGELWAGDSKGLAVIVFIASFVVPILKIIALAVLVVAARRGWADRPSERTHVYRIVEAVGHWSMLDVFVVVLLVGMIDFGAFASVRPEAGMLAFGAVVVLTMIASSSFDPRLLWPRQERRHD